MFVLANTAFNWVRAVSRLTPTEAAAKSIPTPEASLVASLASAAVRPKAAHKFFELGRSGDLRSVREKDQAAGIEQIAAERRDRHRLDQEPRRFVPIDDDWRIGLGCAGRDMQGRRNQLLQSAIAGWVMGRWTTPDKVEVRAKQILRGQIHLGCAAGRVENDGGGADSLQR